jgi:hypothetical protein
MNRALLLLVLGSFSGPLRAQADAPPLETWDSLLPFRQGVALWARNPTEDTIWIDTLFVRACQNVRVAGCGVFPLGAPVAPGESKELLRIRPKFVTEPLGYRWTYSWRTMKFVTDTAG